MCNNKLSTACCMTGSMHYYRHNDNVFAAVLREVDNMR